MKKLAAIFTLSAITGLAGCSTLYGSGDASALPDVPARPSAEWIGDNYALYKLAADRNPTAINVARYHQVSAHMALLGESTDREMRTERGLTLAYDNKGSGGAAMRQPGYVHAVNGDFNELRKQVQAFSHDEIARHLTQTTGLTDAQAQGVIDALSSMESGRGSEARNWQMPDAQGYSMYEMSRWTRFCDGGRGMDERDWQFVDSMGRANVPDVLSECQMPEHGYPDYLRAWERFCEGETTSTRDRLIVRDSSRPHSTVTDCKALNL